MKSFLVIALMATAVVQGPVARSGSAAQSHSKWQQLAPGLELGVFLSPHRSEIGDSLIRVLRVDPQRYAFRLLNASAPGRGKLLTAKEWCHQNGLAAAINASMYQTDYRTSVSLMRTKHHTNNPRLSRDNTILAFDRQRPGFPPVKIIDRECENFNAWKIRYGTFVQSIRMISCKGQNVWSQQPQKWSTAAIGTDRQDRVLFIHVASPYSTHDLINILKHLPLGISRAMYAEGGPEAQLYIRSSVQEFEFTGSRDTGLDGDGHKGYASPIPNVVGIALRSGFMKKKEK
jgi:hypothetical protein